MWTSHFLRRAWTHLWMQRSLSRRLACVGFGRCRLTPAAAPALARLLGSSALTELSIHDDVQSLLLDAPAATLVCPALRASTTLRTFCSQGVDFWRDPGAGCALVAALTGHPSLRTLHLSCQTSTGQHQAAVGAAFGALVGANAPALRELLLFFVHLGDAGLGPVCDALPQNTHLRLLDLAGSVIVSEAFSRERLLPAVRANASLHHLRLASDHDAAREAEALLASRAAALGMSPPHQWR